MQTNQIHAESAESSSRRVCDLELAMNNTRNISYS